MVVTFEPHVAAHPYTHLPIDFRQDRIYVDGIEVGFVGRQPDSPLNFITAVDPVVEEAVLTELYESRRQQPRSVAKPPELPDELDDYDSDAA